MAIIDEKKNKTSRAVSEHAPKSRKLVKERLPHEDEEPVRVGPAGLVIPKKIGEVADLLFATRERRLALERQAAEMKKAERALEDHLIYAIPKQDATGVRGNTAQVTIERTEEPTIENWDEVIKWIFKTKSFDLLQRRINTTSVKNRWENEEEVPGIGKYNNIKVHCSKISRSKAKEPAKSGAWGGGR